MFHLRKASPAKPAMNLQEAVMYGDVDQARALLDKAFWEGAKPRTQFAHLLPALEQQNLPMLQLLVKWGATCDEDHLRDLYHRDPQAYPRHEKLLRQAGLTLPLLASFIDKADSRKYTRPDLETELHEEFIQGNLRDRRLSRVPRQWLSVLDAFSKEQKFPCMIAGGALRDLFNERPIKDVDIFVSWQGSTKKNFKLIERVFGSLGTAWTCDHSGDPTHQSIVHSDYFGTDHSRLESWNINVPNQQTPYNIIFVKGAWWGYLAKAPEQFSSQFDINICRIATDGNTLMVTPEYKEGIEKKNIRVLLPNEGTPEHLLRLHEKYPDFMTTVYEERVLAEVRKKRGDYPGPS